MNESESGDGGQYNREDDDDQRILVNGLEDWNWQGWMSQAIKGIFSHSKIFIQQTKSF